MDKHLARQIVEKKWYIQGFNGCLNYIFHATHSGLIGNHQYLGYGYSEFLAIFKRDYLEYHYLEDDLRRVGGEFLKRYLKRSAYLQTIIEKDRAFVHKSEKVMRTINATDLSFLTKEKLVALYHIMWRAYHTAVDVSHAIEAISFVVEPRLKECLEKVFHSEKHSAQFRELFNALLQPAKPSFVNDEYIELLEIIRSITKDTQALSLFKHGVPRDILGKLPNALKRKIARHTQKYFYNQVNYFYGESLTERDYVKEIKNLLHEGLNPGRKIVAERNKYTKNNRRRQAIMKKYAIDRETAQLLRASLVVLHWQDDRKKNILRCVFYMNLLLKEVAKRFAIPLGMLKHFTPDEIRVENLAHFDRKEGRERMRHFAVYTKRKGGSIATRFYVGKDYRAFMKIYKQKLTEENDVHGTCASSGKTSGIVRICKTKNDLLQFRKGEILVAAMTRPEFVPAMRKAAGIITNEGGLTCHAAIVSRELGIPCIIGTKIATEALRDGDIVEVNANHGVVKKITRQKT